MNMTPAVVAAADFKNFRRFTLFDDSSRSAIIPPARNLSVRRAGVLQPLPRHNTSIRGTSDEDSTRGRLTGVVKKFQSWTYAPGSMPRCKHKTVLTMFTFRVYCFRLRGKMRVVLCQQSWSPAVNPQISRFRL